MSEIQAHVTVATVVEKAGRYLLVEEIDKQSGNIVYNQPAGHLEANESLQEAALRETLEETGWEVALSACLGVALYSAPNGITYCRTTFLAEALSQRQDAELDPDIIRPHWLEYEEIVALSAKMRSPLVIKAIEQHRSGHCYPLDFIYSE